MLFSRYMKFSVLLMLILSVNFVAYSQKTIGTLTGKITDSSTNLGLSRVSISAAGNSKGVTSLNDGTYIMRLAPGTYIISYSFIGYSTKEIFDIVVKSGETTYLDIVLAPKSDMLDNVVVRASVRRETQSIVYNKQRISASASDGISQELISKTPDIDGGQVLKRITGVNVQNDKFVVVRGLGAQYNQTMLNGVAMTSTETNQNAFSFDLIPAAVIDNVVVNKTATADMPGNFAGGVVQVNTKDFPAKDFFSIAVQGGFSDKTYGKDFYSDERGSNEWLGFGGKSRSLPDGFPKSNEQVNITNLNDQERRRVLGLLKNNLAPINQGKSGLNENVQFGYGKTIRFENGRQFGVVAALTQRKSELIELEETTRNPSGFLNPGNRELFRYYSQNTRYKYSSELAAVVNLAYSVGSNKFTFKNLYSQVFRNNFIKRDSVYSSIFDIYESGLEAFSYTSEQRSLINSTLAGEHKLGNNKETQLDWNVNATANNTDFPDTRNFLMRFTEENKVKRYTVNDRGITLPQTLESQARLWSDSDDLITGGAFNLSTVADIRGTKHIVKGGLLFQNRRRIATATALPYDDITKQPIDSVLSASKSDIITNAIGIVSDVGNYNANTALQAAYVSLENKFSKFLRIIWGVRFENYQQSISVYTPRFDPNFQTPELVPTRFESQTTPNFLPSINVVYSPVKSVNVRGAFSRTVIRPDLKDLAPFSRFDFQTFQLTTGNPDLRNSQITNYDFKLEWFPSAGEIISFAAFYKKMIDPIEYGQVTAENVYIGRLAINSGDAEVKGIEFEMRKKLNFFDFAPWMQNITLFTNGSLLSSNVEDKVIYNIYYDFSPSHRLTGQSDYIINAGMSVSALKNAFEATITYNRSGDYINQLGSSLFIRQPVPGRFGKAPLLEVPHFIVQARDIVDIGIRQNLLKNKAQIKFNVSNLLAKPLIVYQDFNGNNKLDTPFIIDRRIVGGGAVGEGKVLSGEDNVASYTIGQRTFYMTFSYTF